jgi:hypothetical protein
MKFVYYWICIWSILFYFYCLANFLIEEKMAATKKIARFLLAQTTIRGCMLPRANTGLYLPPVLVANQIATILVIFPCWIWYALANSICMREIFSLVIGYQIISCTHEVSTPSPVHFLLVHGGVEFFTFSNLYNIEHRSKWFYIYKKSKRQANISTLFYKQENTLYVQAVN